MSGIETISGGTNTFDPRRFRELMSAWMKSGDVTDELRSTFVALGAIEVTGDVLVLTETGFQMGQLLLSLAPLPDFDARTGRLFWRGKLIKSLRRKAEHQRAVLEGFACADWKRSLDDPFDAAPPAEAKKRLRQTVKDLNKGLEPNTIRFHTDKAGRTIRWAPVDAP